MQWPDLPINDILPELIDALKTRGVAVLQAPPGAGKTTVVPLAMLQANLVQGKILLLEPRRLAARAAAERMAETLGEKLGETVGYRIRGQSRIGKNTRIEVLTEGILTAMIQSDPDLPGVGAVIFDEFHERSLNGDLGLALTWEARTALRDDLQVLVMSATLDADPIAALLDCPIITAKGRAFPVTTHWLARPTAKTNRYEDALGDLVVQVTEKTHGGILVFLPGEGEIRRLGARLKGRLPPDCVVYPLFGAMDFKAQRAAIAPARNGRKIVLATAIAETSLTIAGISSVVDGGRARRARFDAASGMSRLVTEPVTKAEAEQRRGRAGRVEAGQAFRFWTKGQEGGMATFPPAEIETGDLSSLVLELALWGAQNAENMAFLTPPNPGSMAAATGILQDLGALDNQGRITAHGRKLAPLPLHPRLAHMLVRGGANAAQLAALLGERDPLRGAGVDLLLRRQALGNPAGAGPARGALERILDEARRLTRHAGNATPLGWAELAALAYPDRIGLRREGEAARWILTGGKEALMDRHDPLANAKLIVVTDLDGDARQARIRQAISLGDAELRGLYGAQITWENSCHWSRRHRRVETRQQEKLGAIALQDRPWPAAPPAEIAGAALDGFRDLGLPLSGPDRRFIARVELLRAAGADLPDMTEDSLMARLQGWLLPHLDGVRNAADIRAFNLLEPLRQSLSWSQQQLLGQRAPSHFTTPMGRKTAVDYGGDSPAISVRLQEMFGLTSHPSIAGAALRITLLSPAGRPLQPPLDLPGFWATSYSDVRKDMRGRYPKHPWPEDPTQAAPTLRVKPRKT